ncbi:hypothetical protein BHE74_00028584 [Ensete ventricosum]|nr:hypothetical protein BHE74_00028584 [Ensete ventricosum]
MEEKMRSLFAEFSTRRPSSRRKSQHGETLDQRDDPQECGYITSDLNNPCMKVDFPRWEEGDLIGCISCAEHYFQFYRTAIATRVEIAAIHLEGDAIQWFNWFEHTHGGLPRQRFKEGLLNCFRPTDFDNIDGQLAKIRAATVHSYGGDFLRAYPGRTIEPRGTKDKGHSPTSHVEAYLPLYYHPSPRTKKVDNIRASRMIGQGVVLALQRTVELLVIEPAEEEDNETSEEALEPKEETMEEESQPADYAMHAFAGYSNPQTIKVGYRRDKGVILLSLTPSLGGRNPYSVPRVDPPQGSKSIELFLGFYQAFTQLKCDVIQWYDLLHENSSFASDHRSTRTLIDSLPKSARLL